LEGVRDFARAKAFADELEDFQLAVAELLGGRVGGGAVARHPAEHLRRQFREKWWLFGRSRPELRAMVRGLARFIATVETAKYRLFQFQGSEILPEHKLVVVGSDDGFVLGVLSSRIHVLWSLSRGALLEDRPVYPKTECFDPFPFPACNEAAKERIRRIAEELDAHRKRAQGQKTGLTLTGMYNLLEKLRANEALTAKEKQIHDAGLVSVLRQLHDDLDGAVFAAYGWPATLTDAEILDRLVALNGERSKEEASGLVRWLRPDYQNPGGAQGQQGARAAEVVGVVPGADTGAVLGEQLVAVSVGGVEG
jgi:hypothetical protein